MSPNLFFPIFTGTIIITRLFLYIQPTASPTILGFRLHHYMYGIVIAGIGVVARSVPVFAVGLGLFVDELPYVLTGGKTHADNYSKASLVGVVILAVLVLILQKQILAATGLLRMPF